MRNKYITGHISACTTIVIWGMTFISTKILLGDFRAMEILFFRFLLGFLILAVVCPERLKWNALKQELAFAAVGAVFTLSGLLFFRTERKGEVGR